MAFHLGSVHTYTQKTLRGYFTQWNLRDSTVLQVYTVLGRDMMGDFFLLIYFKTSLKIAILCHHGFPGGCTSSPTQHSFIHHACFWVQSRYCPTLNFWHRYHTKSTHINICCRGICIVMSCVMSSVTNRLFVRSPPPMKALFSLYFSLVPTFSNCNLQTFLLADNIREWTVLLLTIHSSPWHLSCSTRKAFKQRGWGKSERSINHAKSFNPDCKNKAKPLKRPHSLLLALSLTPHHRFWARNAVALPKGRGSSTRRFFMSKRSHFYLIAAWRLEWTLQHGADRAVEKDSFKLKCSPPPPSFPTSPPHGTHSGMNVSSVRRQQQRWGGGWGSYVFIRNHK